MRMDPYLSNRARRAFPRARVLESPVDGSWWIEPGPNAPWRCLTIGGPVNPTNPRARFHAARAELKRLVQAEVVRTVRVAPSR